MLKPWPNDCKIVGCNVLCVLGHPVAMCCDMMGVVGSNLTIFKLESTTHNISQHVATGWPKWHPAMLRYVTLKCCDPLCGALLLYILYSRHLNLVEHWSSCSHSSAGEEAVFIPPLKGCRCWGSPHPLAYPLQVHLTLWEGCSVHLAM